LNLHSLDEGSLQALVARLEESELDDYTDITTLIGIEFDDNTAWGQLTILELKLLIYLALQQFDEAKELVEAFLQFNDNTVERGLFYQALNVVLEVMLDDELEIGDYQINFRRLFGNQRMDAVLGSVDGSVRFFDLAPTSMKLERLERHQRLIDSYKKLHAARTKIAAC
jgi:ribosomal protein S12 methylthiotransferase accessory factor